MSELAYNVSCDPCYPEIILIWNGKEFNITYLDPKHQVRYKRKQKLKKLNAENN